MTQIKIEVPANDHIALSAMADALKRIAAERAPQELTLSETGNSQPNVTSMVKSEIEQRSNLGIHADKAFDELKPTLNDVESYAKTMKECYGDEELEASIHHENTKHDEAFEEGEKLFDAEITRMDEEREQDDTLDADGIPHDKRIHSKGATRLADNTWRLRKRPADKTEEEWTDYIDSVKTELKAVQDIPSVEPDEELHQEMDRVLAEHNENLPEGMKQGEPCTQGDVDQLEANLTPPVIEEPLTQLEGVTPQALGVAIDPPVAPVTPPTSLTPPVVVEPTVEAPSDQPSVTTFQELMLYITGNAKKRGADNDMIKSVLLEIGGKRENGDPVIPAIPILSTRADLIPKFVTVLEAKLK